MYLLYALLSIVLLLNLLITMMSDTYSEAKERALIETRIKRTSSVLYFGHLAKGILPDWLLRAGERGPGSIYYDNFKVVKKNTA